MIIVTHTNPDFDAIGGVWLLKKYGGLSEAVVRFVNTGQPDKELLEQAEAVVDTGQSYDPLRLRFDHHHLPGAKANMACATTQILDKLALHDPDLDYLWPLVNLIYYGDTGNPLANASRELGLHALLSGYKAQAALNGPPSDLAVMGFGFHLLDCLDERLKNQAKAKAELDKKVVYQSADMKLWAIQFGSQGSTFAAFEAGARLVIFQGEPLEVEGGITHAIGIMRAGEWQEPHCGDLTNRVQQRLFDQGEAGSPMYNEVMSWYRHNAGFFSGRGTAKAPVFTPVTIRLQDLAALFDLEYKR